MAVQTRSQRAAPRRTTKPSSPTMATAASTTGSLDDGTQKNNKRKNKRFDISKQDISIGAILAAAFLNLLGFTLAGPITPALGNHFKLQVGATFGSLTSAYPLGMLLGLFLWPMLSDYIGRKPVIVSSLLGSGLGLALQAVVIQMNGSLSMFLAARALTGAFAGSSPVSKAYLADVGYRNGKLPKYLALRDAASTGAFILGPLMGGLMYDVRRRILGVSSDVAQSEILKTTGSLSFVIGVSAVASFLAAFMVFGLVADYKPKTRKQGGSSASADQSADEEEDSFEEELVACPLGTKMWIGVASVCVVSFLFNVGDSTFHAFFSALLRDEAGLSTRDIGLLYTVLASVSFSVSTTSSSALLQRFGPVVTCAAGMSCVGAALSFFGLAASPGFSLLTPGFYILAAAAALYYCGVPLYGPTIPTMLLRCVPSHRRGAIMGLDGAINTLARVISPLLMGDIYRRLGAGAAFGVAGGAVFVGALITLIRRFLVLRERDQLLAIPSKAN